jgi:hypothetical protein
VDRVTDTAEAPASALAARAHRARPSRLESALLWLALVLAFAPALLDLGAHVAATRWAHYAAVFPALAVYCALREERRAREPRGTLWIGAGLLIEVAAGFLGAIRWARPGLVLALLGMLRREGIGSWPARALWLFAIPMPAFLVRLGSGPLAYAMTEAVAAAWRALGLAVSVERGIVHGAGGGVLVVPDHDWLFLAGLLAGLAWYDGVRLRRPPLRSLGVCAAAVGLALPVQTTALFAAVGVAAAGGTGAAQWFVDHGVWIATALAAVLATEIRAQRR